MNLPNGKKDYLLRISLKVATGAVLLFVSLAATGNTMGRDLGRDEGMYCTAGHLMAEGQMIYRDFSYAAQWPCHPLLLATVYKITSTSHYLLFGRLVTAASVIGIYICLVGICRKLLRDNPVWPDVISISAVMIYHFNWYVDYSNGYAWNHPLVVLCTLVSIWIFICINWDRHSLFLLFALGLFSTTGAFMRPTAALFLLLLAVGVFVFKQGKFTAKCGALLPFVIGSAVAAAWPISVILRGPKAFLLNAFTIPALNAEFLYELGWIRDKANLTVSALTTPSYLLLIISFVCLLFLVLKLRKKPVSVELSLFIFLLAITAVSFITIFIPPTMWQQYWAVPVPFLIISCVCAIRITLLSDNKKVISRIVAYGVLIVVAVSLFDGLGRFKDNISAVFNRKRWVPLEVHTKAERINEVIEKDGPVLTLSPLYAIEGGRNILPQFSAGPFVYRIADRLSPKQKQIVHAAGPVDIEKLMRDSKPCAVIVGKEPPLLEEPIKNAVKDWQGYYRGDDELQVYYRK